MSTSDSRECTLRELSESLERHCRGGAFPLNEIVSVMTTLEISCMSADKLKGLARANVDEEIRYAGEEQSSDDEDSEMDGLSTKATAKYQRELRDAAALLIVQFYQSYMCDVEYAAKHGADDSAEGRLSAVYTQRLARLLQANIDIFLAEFGE